MESDIGDGNLGTVADEVSWEKRSEHKMTGRHRITARTDRIELKAMSNPYNAVFEAPLSRRNLRRCGHTQDENRPDPV
jgi:hypothetical protein